MKYHPKKEEAFMASGLTEDKREAFYTGWYACGASIDEGEDCDWLSERLKDEDFTKDHNG